MACRTVETWRRSQELMSTPGFAAFEERRKSKFDKVVGAGVLLGTGGFEEGFDRERQ